MPSCAAATATQAAPSKRRRCWSICSDASILSIPILPNGNAAASKTLDREVALLDLLIVAQFLNRRAIHDLAFIDHSGVGGDAKAKMHVLFSQQDSHAHGAQRLDEIAYRPNDEGGEPFARLVE